MSKEGESFMSKPHKKLIAWRKSMDLVEKVYELTKNFPREEIYGLSSQLRRAAVSVPSNIAEGAADRSQVQFRNYLSVAVGSLNEMATQLEIAFRIGTWMILHSNTLKPSWMNA